MEQTTTILDGFSNLEKGTYLGAIASLATADRSASEEEKDYIAALCESARLTEDQTKLIEYVATVQLADEDLNRFLDVLKTSDLRFSLVSDLIAFAHADKNYSEEEKQIVEKISQYLGLKKEQLSVLDEFTKKAVQDAPNHAKSIQPEKTKPQSFLDSLGFGDKLKSAGINLRYIFKRSPLHCRPAHTCTNAGWQKTQERRAIRQYTWRWKYWRWHDGWRRNIRGLGWIIWRWWITRWYITRRSWLW